MEGMITVMDRIVGILTADSSLSSYSDMTLVAIVVHHSHIHSSRTHIHRIIITTVGPISIVHFQHGTYDALLSTPIM